MSEDDIKARFLNAIEMRGRDDRYIDSNEEREILEIAIQMGLGAERARSALAQVCGAQQYVMESAVLKSIREQLQEAVGKRGRIDRRAFDRAFENGRRAVAGKKSDRDVKKMIVLAMEDAGYIRVKTGWFSDWYSAVKRDLGMV